MILTIATEDDNIHTVEVEDAATVSGLMTVIEFHTGVPASEQHLWHNSRQLQASAQLSASGIDNNDLILLRQAPPGSSTATAGGRPEELIQQLRNHPQFLSQLPPAVSQGLQQNDPTVVRQLAEMLQAHQAGRRQANIDALNQDEFDPEAQAKIAEYIRQENIEANVDAAMEHSPEVFGEVVMLYVKLHVNNVPLKAFIDSGAQRCVMSLACAERCNIAHLIDKRYRTISRGVGGEQMDVGRVHSVSVKVQNDHIPMAVSVLEQLDIDFLFGLDMLRRHRCSIDLGSNCLRFGSLNDISLDFLPEHEIPNRQVPGSAAAGKAGSSQSPLQAAGAAAVARAAATPKVQNSTGQTSQPSEAKSSVPQTQPQTGNESAKTSADLQQLIGLGFSREQCLQALQATGGNVDHAAALLFGG